MQKRRSRWNKGAYKGYIAKEDFRLFCEAVVAGPEATLAAGKVILEWLAKEKKGLLKEAKMIEDLLERYG